MSEDISSPAVAAPIPQDKQRLLLLELADRCERHGPNLFLRCDIAKALGWREVNHDCHIRYIDPAGRMCWATEIPDWPGSLDSAVTLVPEGHEWLRKSPGAMTVYAVPVDDKTWAKHIECAGKTPALALCAASLKARAAL